MANVNIKFNGKDYLLSCDDGQEESLKKLTSFLDKKYFELKKKLLSSQTRNYVNKFANLQKKFNFSTIDSNISKSKKAIMDLIMRQMKNKI